VLTVPDELLRPFESVRESLRDWGTRERFQCLSSSIKATLDEIKAIVDGIHCPPGPTNAMRDRTHCPPGESNAIRDRTHCPPGATNAMRDRTHYPPGEMKAMRDRTHYPPGEMKVMRDGRACSAATTPRDRVTAQPRHPEPRRRRRISEYVNVRIERSFRVSAPQDGVPVEDRQSCLSSLDRQDCLSSTSAISSPCQDEGILHPSR